MSRARNSYGAATIFKFIFKLSLIIRGGSPFQDNFLELTVLVMILNLLPLKRYLTLGKTSSCKFHASDLLLYCPIKSNSLPFGFQAAEYNLWGNMPENSSDAYNRDGRMYHLCEEELYFSTTEGIIKTFL